MKEEHATFFCTEFNHVLYQMKGPGYKYCFNISCKEEEAVVHIKGPFSEITQPKNLEKKLLQCPKILSTSMST